jgi:BirA family biotin operon repressor/biotin-[acetyl-CoA-carboxylase] ligase
MPTPFGPFIILSKVESTNNYAMAKLHAGILEHGSALMAIEQTTGKGQRGKHWVSKPGENITMSTVYAVSGRFASFPFIFSASIALGCYDFIKECGVPDLSIKWPNDIYSGDRKAAGILIENLYRGSNWQWAVAGTGINLNQQVFDIPGKEAISIRTATGKDNDLIVMGRLLHRHLCHRYQLIQETTPEQVMSEYNSVLYKKGTQVTIRKGNIAFHTIIREVSESGELITYDSLERRFTVGEVEFA